MIAIDTNILVYAHMLQSPWNERAYRAIGDLVVSARRFVVTPNQVSAN